MDKQSNRKKLQGKVSNVIDALSIVVRVERKFAHPLYGKIIASHKKYIVHTNNIEVQIGDTVNIESGKPLSKKKNFYLIDKV